MKKFTNKFYNLLFLLFLNSLPSAIQGATVPPPYIAFNMGENLLFEEEKCLTVTEQVLEEDGFKRINRSGNGSILASYKKTRDYQYKALVSCLPAYGIVRIVVVTELSGQGADKAQKLLKSIENQLKVGNELGVFNSTPDKKSKTFQKGEKSFQKGNLYFDGDKVPQDFAQAIQWYRQAAEEGHYQAQHKLGLLYYQGQHIPQDFVQAYMWLLLASAQGKKEAVEAREQVMKHLSPPQIEEAQRRARELYGKYMD